MGLSVGQHHSTLSGSICVSIINPSKLRSRAVCEMSCRISLLPAMCEGSQINGK